MNISKNKTKRVIIGTMVKRILMIDLEEGDNQFLKKVYNKLDLYGNDRILKMRTKNLHMDCSLTEEIYGNIIEIAVEEICEKGNEELLGLLLDYYLKRFPDIRETYENSRDDIDGYLGFVYKTSFDGTELKAICALLYYAVHGGKNICEIARRAGLMQPDEEYETEDPLENCDYMEQLEEIWEIKDLKNNPLYKDFLARQRVDLADYMEVEPEWIEEYFVDFGIDTSESCISTDAILLFAWMEESLFKLCDKNHICWEYVKEKICDLYPVNVKWHFENLCAGFLYGAYCLCSEEFTDLPMDIFLSEVDTMDPETLYIALVASVYFGLLAESLDEVLEEYYRNFSFDRSMEIDRGERLKAENERLKDEIKQYEERLKEYQHQCSKADQKQHEDACRQKEYTERIDQLTRQLEDKKRLSEKQQQMLSDREDYIKWLEREEDSGSGMEPSGEMQACGKKIAFIGGEPEVVQRLKSVFYNGVFVDSETADIPKKIDGIVMFPKSISQNLFYKFKDLARERKAAVVYCKGTDMDVIYNSIKSNLIH